MLVRLEQVEAGGLDVTDLPTGLADLDRKLGGLQPSTLVVAAGRPGMGKSALAMNIASHIAINHGPVAFFSMEMSPHRNRLPAGWVPKPGRLDEATVRTRGRKLFPDMGGSGGHKGPRTVTDIRAKCRRLKRKTGVETGRSRLHATDAQPQPREPPTTNRRDQPQPQILARELDVPVIAVSQLNGHSKPATTNTPNSVTYANPALSNKTPT